MKEKRNLMLFLPIIVFVMVFGIIYIINSSYAINTDVADADAVAIPSGTVYKMKKKNIYSYHLITNNFNSFSSTNASGTKLIETKNDVAGKKRQAVVYCATEGKTLSQSANRKRYSIDSKSVSLDDGKKNKLKNAMTYMYPYIKLGETSATVGSLKEILSDPTNGLGSKYNDYKFNNLTVQEATTAVQAAIWNIIKGSTTYYAYRGTIGDFSAFDTCKEFYSGKINTSEEDAWHQEDSDYSNCNNKKGKFYKYVVNHKKDGNTKNRINTLISWYVTKAVNLGSREVESFNVTSSFDQNDKKLTITATTNLSSYKITFKDEGGTTLLETTNTSGNTFEITNVSDSVKSVSWFVEAQSANDNVYYYKATSGQDFIGLEHDYLSLNGRIDIERVEDKGKLIIYKVSKDGVNVNVETQSTDDFEVSRCGSSATNCLSNAKFELYYQNKNNLYKEFELDYNDLRTVSLDNLPKGTYYLKETQPAYGYDLYTYGVAPVDNDGYIEFTINSSSTIAVVVNNVKTNICFRKIDGTSGSNLLSHAVFQIQDIDGSVVEVFETSEQQTGGYCIDGQLQTGSYFLQEIKAPSGYSINTNKYHFTIGHGENSIDDLEDKGDYVNVSPINGVITITDKKEVEISKSDATTGECVAGAELVIRDSNGEVVKDSNGVEIGRWISTCSEGSSGQSEEDYTCVNGYTSYDDTSEDDENEYICTGSELEKSKDSHKVSLPAGTYTLTETMTEELRKQGYSSESETITFTVDEDGKVADKIDMKDAPINVCIYKVSKNSKTPLAGAKFKLYNENDELVRTIETSSVESDNCISYIPFGTYTIKEIEAPSGYKAIDKEITIEIKDTKQKQEFYIENELVVPKTSLNTTNVLAIISIIFMAFGLGTVGYYVYKKKN